MIDNKRGALAPEGGISSYFDFNLRLLAAAAGSDGGGEFSEEGVGFGPVDAGVGNALPVDEGLTGNERLCAGHQVALDHYAHDASISCGNLPGDIVADDGLAAVVLAAVGVGEVDHDARL
jgi:hypothetical protein